MEHMQRINEIRKLLISQGYHPYQIHEIIYDCLGHNQLERISEAEASAVIACLEDYICFAQKCQKTKK